MISPPQEKVMGVKGVPVCNAVARVVLLVLLDDKLVWKLSVELRNVPSDLGWTMT